MLLENTLVIFNDEYLHPGGNFITERLFKKHITKYYYGVKPYEGLPYNNLYYTHRHLNTNEDLVIKEYKTLEPQNRILEYYNHRLFRL